MRDGRSDPRLLHQIPPSSIQSHLLQSNPVFVHPILSSFIHIPFSYNPAFFHSIFSFSTLIPYSSAHIPPFSDQSCLLLSNSTFFYLILTSVIKIPPSSIKSHLFLTDFASTQSCILPLYLTFSHPYPAFFHPPYLSCPF